MIKLTNILSELNVNKPLSKTGVIKQFLFQTDNYRYIVFLLSTLCTYDNIERFIEYTKESGYDSIEECLLDEYEILQEDLPGIINLIKSYYNVFKSSKELYFEVINKNSENIVEPIQHYNTFIGHRVNDVSYIIIFY